ncbi:MAG TPA: hypothetical protein VJB14_17725 [Planctomycetota bacterium]|nr:hypothetical protein [Planctomycetota bacterium]
MPTNGRACLAALLLLATAAWGLPQQQQPQKVDDAKVDAAIKAGVLYLRTKMEKKSGGTERADELALLTLLHSGVRKGDPVFDAILKRVLEEKLETTYRVSLQAMALEELDRVTHQKRIFHCAQFLVDNQCKNGQWSYGEPTRLSEPMEEYDDSVLKGTIGVEPDPNRKPLVQKRIPAMKQRGGRDHGDHSNSQFAALGLRACLDAGILLPREVIETAARTWREVQCAPKGGWSYGPKGNPPYGSMTAGGVAALCLYDHLLKTDWKKDEAVAAGIRWLEANFTVTENPGRNQQHVLYYLYALERACMMYGTATLGKADWYAEGAKVLLDSQLNDGSWRRSPIETCYALLFLKRATRPLLEPRDLDRKTGSP